MPTHVTYALLILADGMTLKLRGPDILLTIQGWEVTPYEHGKNWGLIQYWTESLLYPLLEGRAASHGCLSPSSLLSLPSNTALKTETLNYTQNHSRHLWEQIISSSAFFYSFSPQGCLRSWTGNLVHIHPRIPQAISAQQNILISGLWWMQIYSKWAWLSLACKHMLLVAACCATCQIA